VDRRRPQGTERDRTKVFPGETFRLLKEREIKEYGEYRTRRLVLEAWDRLQEALPHLLRKPVQTSAHGARDQ
jgi:hypothetical protein